MQTSETANCLLTAHAREYDYRIVDPPNDDYNEPFKRFIERLTARQSNGACRSALPSLRYAGSAVRRHVLKYTRRYAS